VTPRRGGIPLQGRFGFAYFALAVVVGLAVGLLIVFLGRPGHSDDSQDHPTWLTLHGTAGAKQIADYVGGRYRLDDGSQLVAVAPELPQYFPQGDESVRISKIAVRPGNPDDSNADISVFDTGRTIAFVLCGLSMTDKHCSIPGKPTLGRLLLVRREALDLAIYTFKYLPDFDSVLAFVPSAAGTTSSEQPMLFFRRSELEPRLNALLGQTLSLGPVLSPGTISTRDLAIAQQLTIADLGSGQFSGFYAYRLQQSPDGTFFLVLAPSSA
jgi:hypothetical protein